MTVKVSPNMHLAFMGKEIPFNDLMIMYSYLYQFKLMLSMRRSLILNNIGKKFCDKLPKFRFISL